MEYLELLMGIFSTFLFRVLGVTHNSIFENYFSPYQATKFYAFFFFFEPEIMLLKLYLCSNSIDLRIHLCKDSKSHSPDCLLAYDISIPNIRTLKYCANFDVLLGKEIRMLITSRQPSIWFIRDTI